MDYIMQHLHYVIVVTVVAAIVLYQLGVFLNTLRQINQYKNLFPDFKGCRKLLDVYNSVIIDRKLVDKETKELKATIEEMKKRKNEFYSIGGWESISDLSVKIQEAEKRMQSQMDEIAMDNEISLHSVDFSNILKTINGYLLKNRTGNTDYHLMKDIVDRCADTKEDNISTQVPIPLYAGLMGTMVGAIIGIAYLWLSGELAALLGAADASVGGTGIEALLACVAMAMVASLVGILLTTIGSMKLKTAKNQLALNKDSFLSWLQQNLLPAIANDTSSALIRVSQDLARFGSEFTQNTNKLQQTIGTLNSTTLDQKELIDNLQQINITKVAKANVDVYEKLKDCTEEIGNLTSFLSNSRTYLEEVKELNSKLDKDDRRSKALEGMATFFEKELNQIEERKRAIGESVDKVDDKAKESLGIIEETSKKQFDALNTYIDKQTEDLKKKSQELSSIVEELKKLTPLEKVVSQLQQDTKEQNVKMNKLMECIENLAKAKADGGSGTIQPWFTMLPTWLKIVMSFGGVLFLLMCGLVIFMIVEQRFSSLF